MRALSRLHVGLLVVAAFVIAVLACTPRSTPPRKATATRADKPSVRGVQHGLASWYGGRLHGNPTASGEKFNKHAMTAAHRTLKMGTWVRVTRTKNGRSVKVRINDRGPFGGKGRIIDLSEAAARKLDMLDDGVAKVRVEVLK